MNKAEKIIKLVLDQELYNMHFEGDEHMGAHLLKSALCNHFRKHIQSFAGKTMFESENSVKEIEKLLNRKVSFYCRSILHGDVEKQGSDKMLKHIKEQFTLIISQ